MKFLSKLQKKDLSKEICLLRVDFNVERWEDSLRIEAAVPTIKWLLARKAKILIITHRGRPGNLSIDNLKNNPSLTLQNLIPFLSECIGKFINFIPDFNFTEIKDTLAQAPPASIFLLENLRFLSGEEINDKNLAENLASLGTMYVNDAFAVSHRKNASITGIPKYLPSYAGLLFEKEFRTLSRVLGSKTHPLVIIGGAKAGNKVGVIKNFLKKAEKILVGGATANTLLKADGIDIKNSVHDSELVDFGKKLLKNKNVLVPRDWLMENDKILDIGPLTIEEFVSNIEHAKMIIWNGPLGLIENKKFTTGTIAVANAIANSKAFSVIGGGETTQFLISLGLQNKFSFLSTGGGAMLEFLAGKKLPGIDALNK